MTNASAASPVPVTVVGGYLGAGKTTLINRVLANTNGLRVAVLVNDFGSVNIDEALIASVNGNTVSLSNGCVCCSIADGLALAMGDLATADPPFHHVVIEVSGVGDPWKVAQWGRSPGFTLDGVVVLAGADAVREQAADRYIGDTVIQQLRGADLVVLTRTDLVEPAALAETRAWMDQLSSAPIIESHPREAPLALLMGTSEQTAGTNPQPMVRSLAEHATHQTWTLDTSTPVERQKLDDWLQQAPATVWRAKGAVHCLDRGPTTALVQLVGKRVEVTRAPTTLSNLALVIIASPAAEEEIITNWLALAPRGWKVSHQDR